MRKFAHLVNSQPRLLALYGLSLAVLAGCTAGPAPPPVYPAGPIEHQLMGEIALQRGEYLVSVQQYLSLAQYSDDPEFARRSTELAYDYGFDAYALASAERWVSLAPDDLMAHSYLGRLYVRRGFPDKAWVSLNKALGPIEERSDADYTVLSEELAEQADPGQGLQLFQRFNAETPGVAAITGSIMLLAAEAGDIDQAIAAARETVVLAPDWVGARVWLARFLLAADEQTSAFEQMAFVLEMVPGLEMELEFVRLLTLAGEYADALERLERLDSRYPDSPELRQTRAALLLQMGDLAGAQADFMQLLTDAYFVNECFWYLGQIALQQGDYLQAMRYFSRVSAGGWQLPARLSMSQAYIALGDTDTALEVLREFAAGYPRQAFDTLEPRAEILAGAGDTEAALAIIGEALDYKPWNADLWLSRGGLYERSGQYEQAVQAFRKAVEFAPGNPTALNALGYTLSIATRQYAEAQALISRALELQPENPAIMDSMGWVLFKQGERDAARLWLERAYSLMPDPEVAAHLGEVLWVSGEHESATELWMNSLADYPDHPVLNETIRRFAP